MNSSIEQHKKHVFIDEYILKRTKFIKKLKYFLIDFFNYI